jgi:hypothetical protein
VATKDFDLLDFMLPLTPEQLEAMTIPVKKVPRQSKRAGKFVKLYESWIERLADI